MGAKHRTAVLLAAALILLAAVATSANAHGPMPGTEQVEVTLPADGAAVATRAPMPASSTTGTVTVSAQSDDPSYLDELTFYLAAAPTRGARVVACVYAYSDLSAAAEAGEVDFSLSEPSLQLLFFYSCIKLALSMGQQQNGAPHLLARAAPGCNPLPVAAPIHITKTASGYTATVKGTPSKAKNLKFRLACKRSAKSVQLTVRAKSRKVKLAKAIGPILTVGLSSKSSSTGKVKIALGVR